MNAAWPHKFGGVEPEARDPRARTTPAVSPQPTKVSSTPPKPFTGWPLLTIWVGVVICCLAVWTLIVWAVWSLS